MKAGERPKLARGLRQDSRRFRLLAIVVGFFVVSLTFVVVSKPDAILFSLNGKLPVEQAPTSILIRQKVKSPPVTSGKTSTDALRGDPKVVDDEADVRPKGTKGEEEESRVLSEPDPTSGMTELTTNKDGGGGHKSDEEKALGGGGKQNGKGEERGHAAAEKHKVTLPTVSNYTIHDIDETENAKQDVLELVEFPTFGTRAMVNDGEASSSAKESSSVTLQYPLLTRSNYTAWAIKMKACLKAQGVWEAIDMEKGADTRKDQMALAAIYQGIPEETLLLLAEKETSREAWQMLKTMHMGVERVMEAKVQTLKSELDVLRMKEGDSIDDFAMKLTSVVSKIRALGEKVEETYVVKKLLRVVPKKFLQVVSTIEQFGDFKTMTVEEVIGRLNAYEERICTYADGEGEHLLLTRAEWRAKESKGGKRNKKFDKAKACLL
ncbi:hypothetical protein ACP70R_049299 [Stipagrostis hirtigluma subsp. patula]